MKKVIGICLIVPGTLLFLFCGYGFYAFLTTNKEKFTAMYAQRGQDAAAIYPEGIDSHIRNGRTKTGLLTLAGAGITLFGLSLCRKPKLFA